MSKETNLVRRVGILPFHGADPIPVGKIPDDGTQIYKHKVAEGTTQTIHTVTALKTLYLSYANVTVYNASGGPTTVNVTIRDNLNAVQGYLEYSRVPDDGYATTPHSFFPPLELLAGWYIQEVSEAANVVIVTTIHGYEA